MDDKYGIRLRPALLNFRKLNNFLLRLDLMDFMDVDEI